MWVRWTWSLTASLSACRPRTSCSARTPAQRPVAAASASAEAIGVAATIDPMGRPGSPNASGVPASVGGTARTGLPIISASWAIAGPSVSPRSIASICAASSTASMRLCPSCSAAPVSKRTTRTDSSSERYGDPGSVGSPLAAGRLDARSRCGTTSSRRSGGRMSAMSSAASAALLKTSSHVAAPAAIGARTSRADGPIRIPSSESPNSATHASAGDTDRKSGVSPSE